MEPRTFCDALNREAGDYLLATVLEGAAQGAQLLLCGGVPVWPEHPAACLEAQLPALQQVTASGVQTFEALRVFAERFGAAPRLVVCGGGHVAAALVKQAKLRQAGADSVLCLPFEEGLAAVSGGAECYFVVVTRAHSCDVQCLTAILQKPAAYVGMMGSRGRAALVRRQLTEAGLDPARVEQLHAPIGLAIGAKTAEEIALSILSRHGSTPREVGSKMLVLPEGRAVGSVGGGIMEYRIQQLAGKMLAGAAAPAQLADLTTDGTGDDAAIAACGGSMQVFLQRIEPEE